jgi:hypothetical protein
MPLVTWQEFTGGQAPRGGTIKELVLSEVANLITKRRPLMGQIAHGNVQGTFVEALEDTLGSRSHNATLEGAAATDPALTQPSRLFYTVQSFSKWGKVSDEQRLVAHYNEDPYAYQKGKQLDQLLNDIEHTLHRGSHVTGATSSARQLDGMLNIFGTATFTDSSGTTLTEGVFIDLQQSFGDNNYDTFPTQCYVNSWLKRTISEYSTKITRNSDMAAAHQQLVIERHTSDFGDLDVFYTIDQLKSASRTTSGNSLIFIDPTAFSVGWLRRPMIEDLARGGLNDQFQMNAMCTLVYKSAKAGGGGLGYVPYITAT